MARQLDQHFRRSEYDAVIVGSGPNGLTAGVELARAGLSTLVVEAHSEIGGGSRTSELTLPGYRHDVCSTVHPLGVGSPYFKALKLEQHGLRWCQPPAAVAHVLRDGRAVLLERSVSVTAEQFARDSARYRELMAPLSERFDELARMVLSGLRVPEAPWLMARFGMAALRSLSGLAKSQFGTAEPRALLAGIAAHCILPLDAAATASFGLVLASAGHAVGWPLALSGSASISAALEKVLLGLGGEIVTGFRVREMEALPRARAYLFDVAPRALSEIAGTRFDERFRRQLRQFRHGPGVFKVDWALSEPIPWRDPRCLRSATVHVSGTLEQIAASEAAAHQRRVPERPFLLVVQPTLFDPLRAPEGRHIAWAYCHVPHASSALLLESVEREIDAVAPGFRDVILARHTRTAAELENYNPNFVGGDIAGGMSDLRQLFFRPVPSLDPYATPARDVFLCSASTPPGGGVHGMCGYWAARSALRRVFGRNEGTRLA